MASPQSVNPYRPPSEAADVGSMLRSGGVRGLWREGKLLVVAKYDHEFPDRCVICNAPADGFRIKRTSYWHSPWIYLLILVSIIVYVVVALLARKSARIEFGLCPEHRARRRLGLAIGIGGFSLCFVFLFAAAIEGSGYFFLPLIGLVVFAAVGIVLSATLPPKYIDDRIARFAAGEPFLASLERSDAE